MLTTSDILFSPLPLRNITLPNRLLRSATYEGMADESGFPREALADCYSELARGGVGTLITGFVYISPGGRAMQPFQCGIDTDEKIARWRQIIERTRSITPEMKLFMQLVHAGRQTCQVITGQPVVGASTKRCTYFRQQVQALDDSGIHAVIADFAEAAYRAQQAGFDGVQLHAAHGYLIHQFLSPWTNTRRDRWAEQTMLLTEIVQAIQRRCGASFPLLVKLSSGEDTPIGLHIEDVITTVKALETLAVDAVEISYGTMEYALSIIRGAMPVDLALKINPLYSNYPAWVKRLWKSLLYPGFRAKNKPFSEDYNLAAAVQIQRATRLPVISVGGFRRLDHFIDALATHGIPAISLCRPLICEPDLPAKIRDGSFTKSRCTNCNLCTIHCDGREPLRCYQQR